METAKKTIYNKGPIDLSDMKYNFSQGVQVESKREREGERVRECVCA